MRPLCRATAILLAACVALSSSMVQGGENKVTFEGLLDEMVDRDAAARFPDPTYTCRQQSSFDPEAVSPDEPGTWFANADWSHFRRMEVHDGREEWVMLDAPGPGAVVRIWCTAFNPRGTVRVYIDDGSKPVIEERIDQLIGGDAVAGPPMSEVTARGMNFYMPIPYAKHCVITYDRPYFWKTKKREDQLYYQINYRTYEPGTMVESFGPADMSEFEMGVLALVQKALLEPEAKLPPPRLEPVAVTIQPGGSAEDSRKRVAEGPGAIRRLMVRLEAKNLEAATRSTVISIEFDNHRTVWCPVGDFFGSGVGVNPYKGWWRQVDKDGWMACYWVMPFQSSYKIRFENHGEEDVDVAWHVTKGPWQWDDRSMYFHCNWRQQYPIDTSTKHDWNYVALTGEGVYMGDTLCVANPVQIWWGEGDEKIYVDGEKFPSHFGTGTEDYYGYAWCTPEFFQSPFHAQPRSDGPGNFGHVTNTRVRLLDGIPFRKSLKFDMEVWHWRPVEVAYAATTYWYGMPGSKANLGPAPEQAKVYRPEPPKPRKVEGALEGESLKIVEKTGGETEIQDIPMFKWSDSKQLWWRDGKPGDKLVLAVPVTKAGKYKLTASLTKAIDYGIVRLHLDDKPLGGPIDLMNDGVIWQEFDLGTCELEAGEHKLTVEVTGSNPRAAKRHMFGLDYLKLNAVD